VFESVGGEPDRSQPENFDREHTCGSGCGSGGCGSGGCGHAGGYASPRTTATDAVHASTTSAAASHGIAHTSVGGCESCGISRLLASRRR
jgi:hypothetical protein